MSIGDLHDANNNKGDLQNEAYEYMLSASNAISVQVNDHEDECWHKSE